ncbi:hypothetical protein DFH28DRAFT_907284, partial [Melampsora americana]
IPGPTSDRPRQDPVSKEDMKAALSKAGFQMMGDKILDRDLTKLYKRHVFECSKSRKRSGDSTPYDEQQNANIRAARYSRTVYFDLNKDEDSETRVERRSSLSCEGGASSVLPNDLPSSIFPSTTSSNSQTKLPELESESRKASSGPVRPVRISARLSAQRRITSIPEVEEQFPKALKNKSRGNRRSYPAFSSPRQRVPGIRDKGLRKIRTIPESDDDLTQDVHPASVGEEARNSEAEESDRQDLDRSERESCERLTFELTPPGNSDTFCLSRLPKKVSNVPSNPFGLRVSHPKAFPKKTNPNSRKKEIKPPSDSEAESEDYDKDNSSEDYSPSGEDDGGSDSSTPSSSKDQFSDLPPRSKSKKKARTMCDRDKEPPTSHKRSRVRTCRTKSFNRQQSSSDGTPPRLTTGKERAAFVPEIPESSEDTPDLLESSNFRRSPVITRRSSLLELNQQSHSAEPTEPAPSQSQRRRKGKARASNQEHPTDEEEDGKQNSYNPVVADLEEMDENWDAGDLFGENFTANSPKAGPQFDYDQSNADKDSSRPQTDDIQDIKESLLLLKALVVETHSKQIEQMNNKIEVLSNTIQAFLNTTPPTNTRAARTLGNSPAEISEDAITPRSGRIRVLIKTLIRTLYGLKKNQKGVPDGASSAEKRNWIQSVSMQALLEKAGEPLGEVQTPVSPTGDPNFPYPNGPGGEKVGSRALQIMWDVMQRLRVRSFRPDYSGPLSSPSNMFLFRMATVILIKLVESGEYTGVASDDLEPKKVLELIVSHVRGTWFRNYREQREWSQQRLQSRDKRKLQHNRINRVREGRLAYVLSHKPLWPLSKVIQECCSDDETDYEDDQGLKHCKVRIVPWRSSLLDSVFQRIDEARVRSNSIKLHPGNQHRIRSRSHDNPISQLVPPAEIYKDCISTTFYNRLEPWEKADIKIINQSILSTVREMISRNVLPQPL